MKKQKKIGFLVFIISLIPILWNAIHYFKYLSDGSEFAGQLIRLGIKVKLIFLSILVAFVITLITKLLLKKYAKQIVIPIALLLTGIGFLWSQYAYHRIVFPPEQTIEDKIKQAKEITNNYKIAAEKELKNGVRFLPDSKIINHDKAVILSHVKELLTTDSVGKDKINDSIHFRKINLFFGFVNRFDKTAVKFLESMKKTIQIDFITYSPDYNRFLITFSFKTDKSFNDLYPYGGLIFIGEKCNSLIELYNYSQTLPQFGFYNRQAVLNASISTFSYLSRNLIDEKYKTHPSVLTKEFWNCPFFFSSVQTSTGEYSARFKTRREFVYEKPAICVKRDAFECDLMTLRF